MRDDVSISDGVGALQRFPSDKTGSRGSPRETFLCALISFLLIAYGENDATSC